jgi:hypothetical protein
MINQNRTQCPNGCPRAALDAFIIITNPVAIGLNQLPNLKRTIHLQFILVPAIIEKHRTGNSSP